MDNVKLVLEALSPVHIGSAERGLEEGEFIKVGGYCYVVDDEKLASALYDWNLNEDFSDTIERGPGEFRLHKFLQDNDKVSESDLVKIAGYRMELTSSEMRLRHPKPFTRDGKLRPYIPGTAVKGAIRTAILFSIIKRHPDGISRLENYVTDEMNDLFRNGRPSRWALERQKKWFAQKLTEGILTHFDLTREQKRYGPQTDVMRCLKLSDSLTPLNGLKMEQVALMNVAAGGRAYDKEDTMFHVECLPANTRVEFVMGIDQNTLEFFKRGRDNKVPFESLNDIFGMIDEFGKEQWQAERRYFNSARDSERLELGQVRSFYQADYVPALRIGWGSGLLGTTVYLLLSDELRKRLRNALFADRGNDEAPKSRRLTVSQREGDLQTQKPLGWMAIRG